MAHQFCWELVSPMVSPRFCKERPPADSPREERYTEAGDRVVLSRLGPLQHLSGPRAPGLAAAIPTITEMPPQLVSVGAAAPPPSTLGSHLLCPWSPGSSHLSPSQSPLEADCCSGASTGPDL